jgi:hypothetical protein
VAAARIVAFRIYHAEQISVEGKFLALAEDSVSCFGEYREVELGGESGASIFEGAIMRHRLEPEGGVSIEIDLYAVDGTAKVPKQVRILRAGISMGADAGEDRSESVMLGETHEFVYKTRVVG